MYERSLSYFDWVQRHFAENHFAEKMFVWQNYDKVIWSTDISPT